MQALRSEVEAQGGRTAALPEVLVAVAQAGWEGEGEGGQMILKMWDSLKWACWGRDK